MILSNKRITKALIRLCGCPGWSGPVLFAKPQRQVLSRRGPYYMRSESSGKLHVWAFTSHWCHNIKISFAGPFANQWNAVKKTRFQSIGTPSQIPAFELTKASAKFEVATSNRLGGDAFTRKYIISLLTLTLGHGQTWKVAQYPLHNMTYAPAKFEAAMSNN